MATVMEVYRSKVQDLVDANIMLEAAIRERDRIIEGLRAAKSE